MYFQSNTESKLYVSVIYRITYVHLLVWVICCVFSLFETVRFEENRFTINGLSIATGNGVTGEWLFGMHSGRTASHDQLSHF